MQGRLWEEMRKVLIVSTVGLIYDGITSVITSYLQAMDLDGLEVYVAGTIDIKPNIRKQIKDCGCTVVEFPNRRTDTIKYFISLTKFIRKNHIDVVHAHGNSATLAVEMVAAWLGGCKKRIAHSHNTKCDQVKADKLLRPIFYFFYTDGLACGEAAGKWLFGNRKFEILANGRDVEKYKFNPKTREKVRTSLGIKNELAIGHVGGFAEQKNHRFLVEIYRELRKLEPNCKLFMIGDGSLKPEIEKLCEGLNVTFTGAIDNIPDYLNAMDGMLLPSLFEGLPLVVVEWQINGLPCVVSDAVTNECGFTSFIGFESLQSSPATWANELLNKVKQETREKNSIEAIIKAKEKCFDISESANRLKDIYIS